MADFLNLEKRLSLYTVPLLYLTALYPHFKKGALLASYLGKYPNVNPRGNIERLKKKGVPEEVIAKYERMGAAHTNGLENWPILSFAILAANVSGVDNRTTNLVSIGLLVSRLIYNELYINTTSGKVSFLRTITWFASVTGALSLIVMSANKLRDT